MKVISNKTAVTFLQDNIIIPILLLLESVSTSTENAPYVLERDRHTDTHTRRHTVEERETKKRNKDNGEILFFIIYIEIYLARQTSCLKKS